MVPLRKLMQLTIAILTYNSERHINDCIRSVLKHFSDSFLQDKYELLIVDNASEDKTIYQIGALFKKGDVARRNAKIKLAENTYLIRLAKNKGFAAGANVASSYAKGDYILFLNPDSVLLQADFESIFELFRSNERIKIIGGKIINKTGITELSAGKFPSLLNLFFLIFGFEKQMKLRFSAYHPTFVDFVSGGFMCVEKKAFFKIGGFDEKLFMYVEDMELCFRARKYGYLTYFTPHSILMHEGQGSSSRSFAIVSIYKGLLYFTRKHKPYFSYIILKQLLKLKAGTLMLIGRLLQDEYLKKTYEEAYRVCR